MSVKLLRVFLDANVILGGLLSEWGLDKAILSLSAAKVIRWVLAEVVQREVETNLLMHATELALDDADHLLEDYVRLIELASPEIIPPPSLSEVQRSRGLIRHLTDVPVLLSAIAAAPDFLITHNTAHFTPEVAACTGLRIVTPREFFVELAQGFIALP